MVVTLFLGGLLNRTFLGVPYYLWVIVGLLMMAILIVGLWYFLFWFRLKPYHGVFWAHISKIGASFVFDDNMHFDLITERSAKVIFNESFKEAQEAEEDRTETPTASIGSVRGDFIFDPDKWTYPKSYQHKIIEDVADKRNEIHPDDQIRTLWKFYRYMSEGKLDEYSDQLKPLKKVYMVPWARIKMMYRDREESGYFGFVMSLANVIKEVEKESLNKYALILLGFFGIIDIVIIVAHYIGK